MCVRACVRVRVCVRYRTVLDIIPLEPSISPEAGFFIDLELTNYNSMDQYFYKGAGDQTLVFSPLFVYIYLMCMSICLFVCVPHDSVPSEGRRGSQIPWD